MSDAAQPDPIDLARTRPDAPRARDWLPALIGDASALVRTAVRDEVERRGRAALPVLRRAERSEDTRIRAHARALRMRLDRTLVVRRMLGHACAERVDLESGLMLMSRFEEPSLDLRPYQLALDAMAAEVAKRVEARKGLDGRAKILADYLGGELGFAGDERDYHHPDNVYVHRAILRKRGLPLTLTALYVLVARRARVRVAPIALPGHVVLRVYDRDERSVLIDPFRKGALLTERECLSYLADHGLPFHPRWFDDTDDLTLWTRHVHNLSTSYESRALHGEVRQLRGLISVLEQRMSTPRAASARI